MPEKGADVVLNAAKRQQHVNDSDPLHKTRKQKGEREQERERDPLGASGHFMSCLV